MDRRAPVRFETRPLQRPLRAALFLLALAAPAVAGPGAFEDLSVETRGGTLPLKVEVMRTPGERARGMMFRTELPPGRGMLFEYPAPAPAAYWMKDTPLPLDIVFLRADGTVARIAARAEPLSTTPIPSGEPVLGVLEIPGGDAARLGIAPGDRVDHPMFRKEAHP